MGTPIHDPGEEFGEDCDWCTPDPWPPGKTPRKMSVTFTGVLKCLEEDPWKVGIPPIFAVITQDELDHCWWEGGGCWYSMELEEMGLDGDRFYDPYSDCHPAGQSNYTCEFHAYENGTWSAEWYDIPGLLMWTYSLYPKPFPLHEFMGLADGGETQVHRFCHPSDKTNIKIKFDTNVAAICRP